MGLRSSNRKGKALLAGLTFPFTKKAPPRMINSPCNKVLSVHPELGIMDDAGTEATWPLHNYLLRLGADSHSATANSPLSLR